MELAKAYNHLEAERSHYQKWEETGCFRPELNQNPDAKPFSIVIPPPNVTGSLHMGHALQHTLMDILIRRKRMLGYRTLWLPGTDHAGISVQRKVVEKIRKELGKTPAELGRDEFLKLCWEWKQLYGYTIIEQIRREGASVDWTRHRFTMDEGLSKAVRAVFCRLYEEGQIYRGKRIVNWCPQDKTVLSDLEVKEETRSDGKLYFLKYPLTAEFEGKFLVVATTRPETMLGDVAVAVNPKDERYSKLIGATIALPLTERLIPVIADEYVDRQFGTGAVKITPAHDPNDFEVALRHNLEPLLVMNDDGSMNESAGKSFAGLDRFKARELVIEKFNEAGLLEKIEDYELVLPICERCKTIVEPILSEQWFVRMDKMRDLALDLIKSKGLPRFSPDVPHAKVYTNWLENLKDWTISRQLWWGHRIPAWYDKDGNCFVAEDFETAAKRAGTTELKQDEDVLDTWFSSALWPFSTMGWDGEVTETEDLERYLPSDVLVTGRDIIFLWVSRMVMMSLKFINRPPFYDVIITGTVLGSDGKPMSKSRNNGVDPIEMFDKYGVDATRIYLASIATGADIRWNPTMIETYRNFANKIWNAARFCLMNSEGAGVLTGLEQVIESNTIENEDSKLRNVIDRWIVSRLNQAAESINKALDSYQFHEAAQTLYHFFWDEFCDWYIELVKDELSSEGEGALAARSRILTVLERALRLLHPFMPFITEEIWQKLPGTSAVLHNPAYSHAEKSIMLSDFPVSDSALIDKEAEKQVELMIEFIRQVRNIRTELNIKPSDRIGIQVSLKDQAGSVLIYHQDKIKKLARISDFDVVDRITAPKASARGVIAQGAEFAVPLEGLIDFDEERRRLISAIEKAEKELIKVEGQLSNPAFVANAPEEKVNQLAIRRDELKVKIMKTKENLEALS
ncbi:MAG TPA: valine--tRNA ligase [Pyrinomonadaceae bacterium]|nr:valine--tRNA ligase [Pyrinomonadaceae bacterium]